MIKQSDLKRLIDEQLECLTQRERGMKGILLMQIPDNLMNHALIVTGIRSCGKSRLTHKSLD